jgi:hypothetical protein
MLPFARGALLVAAALAACACGCARSNAARFTPSAQTATKCVETVLAAWRDGRPLDALATEKPAIHVVDTHRRPEQRLQTFEVLSKSPASAAGWTYVVRLTFDQPAEAVRARFVVVGVDPIWVFRKEDYDHLAHWEHPMPEPLPAEDSPAPPPEKPDET